MPRGTQLLGCGAAGGGLVHKPVSASLPFPAPSSSTWYPDAACPERCLRRLYREWPNTIVAACRQAPRGMCFLSIGGARPDAGHGVRVEPTRLTNPLGLAASKPSSEQDPHRNTGSNSSSGSAGAADSVGPLCAGRELGGLCRGLCAHLGPGQLRCRLLTGLPAN